MEFVFCAYIVRIMKIMCFCFDRCSDVIEDENTQEGQAAGLFLPNHVWLINCCASDHELFFSFSKLFLFPSFWYRFIWMSSFILDFYFLLLLFLTTSNMGFLFLRVSVYRVVVNCLHSWRCLLNIDFDNNTPTFSRVSLTFLDVMKCFLFHQNKNSVIINLNCCPWSSRPLGVGEQLLMILLSLW